MSHPEPDPNGIEDPQVLKDAELFQTLVGHLEEGIYMVDRDRRIHYWNKGAERITGYRAHEVVGQFCQSDLLMHCDVEGTVLCGKACPLLHVMEDGKPHECDLLLRHRHGHYIPVRVRSLAVHGPNGIRGAVEVFEETVSPGRSEIQALDPHGCLDSPTGALTREYGEQKAVQSLAELEKFGVPLGWLKVQLDDAERLEHRYGLGVIDAAMKLIASTVDRNLASLDVLTRWSVTEFRVAVHNATYAQLSDLARKLVVLTRRSSVEWWGDPLGFTVSVGGALAEPGETLRSLEKRSGETCTASRAAGGDRATVAQGIIHSGEGSKLFRVI